MSAFVVEKELIDFLLTFIASRRDGSVYIASRNVWTRGWDMPVSGDAGAVMQNWQGGRAPTVADYIGQILHAENVRSVNHRYRETDAPDSYVFEEHGAVHTMQPLALAVQVCNSIACLDYQSCETDDWERSDAFRILRDIQREAIRSLPGYDSAVWGAPPKPARGAAPVRIRII